MNKITVQDVEFLFEMIGLFLAAIAVVAVGAMSIISGALILYDKVFKKVVE